MVEHRGPALLVVVLPLCAFIACDGGAAGAPGGSGASGGTGGGGDCVGEICNGFDDDCDGEVDEDCPCDEGSEQDCYAGSPITMGVGSCRAGTQPCQLGAWGDCEGAIQPSDEQCNGLDDDCDGAVDEGCSCTDGTAQECYSGDPDTQDVGPCRAGTQQCADGAWGSCVGEVLPETEDCNGGDEDCDGQVDEGCPPPIPARCADQFQDVPTSHMFYDEIHALYVHEVVNGCSPSPLLYCPDDPMLRRHMAMMLVNAMGESPSSAGMNAYFTDLTDPVSSPYVNRLYELGITNGCGSGIFCPDDPLIRDHGAIFLIRAMGESTSSAAQDAYFDDLQTALGWTSINRLYELGITNGCGTRLFCPADPLLRDHAAAFVARGFDYTLAICNP
jgi:hypothetical protein